MSGYDPSARNSKQAVVDELAARRDGLRGERLDETVVAAPDVLLEQYATEFGQRTRLGIVERPKDALAVFDAKGDTSKRATQSGPDLHRCETSLGVLDSQAARERPPENERLSWLASSFAGRAHLASGGGNARVWSDRLSRGRRPGWGCKLPFRDSHVARTTRAPRAPATRAR